MDWKINFQESDSIQNYNQLGRCAFAIEKAMQSGQELDREEIAEIARSMKVLCAVAISREVSKSGDIMSQSTSQEIDMYLNPEEKEEISEILDFESNSKGHSM